MTIIKKSPLLFIILSVLAANLLFLGTNYGQSVLAATAVKKPAVSDPTKSVVGKDPCYNYVKATTLSKTIYDKKTGGRPIFSFYGADAAGRAYGGVGTVVAAGNVAVGGGMVNFGTINNGTFARVNSAGELDFYVKNGRVLNLSSSGITASKGLEIKGNLKTDKIFIGGKEVKSANINGQNILYTDL